MKPFNIKDMNKPSQFFMNCTGCFLNPEKKDQVYIIAANGNQYPVGIQMHHDLSVHLFDTILEAAESGGTVVIPDMRRMDDDEIRAAVDKLKVE